MIHSECSSYGVSVDSVTWNAHCIAKLYNSWGRGAAKHSGSILASHPAAQDSILDIPKNLFPCRWDLLMALLRVKWTEAWKCQSNPSIPGKWHVRTTNKSWTIHSRSHPSYHRYFFVRTWQSNWFGVFDTKESWKVRKWAVLPGVKTSLNQSSIETK